MNRASIGGATQPSDVEVPRPSTSQKLKKVTSSSPPPLPEKETSSKRRSRHDSVTQSPSMPRRSSSFKGILNAYYKVFGGHPPSKAPSIERPLDEVDRLKQVVREYEKQLEEASNTILLQDKVLTRWEKTGQLETKVIKGSLRCLTG
jgi:hypothetical protein